MSKRPNPHRRLLAKQARVLLDVRLAQSAANGEDMAKLQQGRVRSPLNPRVQLTAYSTPRRMDWERLGRRKRLALPRFAHN